MPSKVWDEITYPFPNVNASSAEVLEWVSNSIPHIIVDLIVYPCCLYMSKQGAPYTRCGGEEEIDHWRLHEDLSTCIFYKYAHDTKFYLLLLNEHAERRVIPLVFIQISLSLWEQFQRWTK